MNGHKAGCDCNYCEHINNCVVSHNKLVEALEDLINDIKDNFSGTGDIEYISKSFKQAKKAIKEDLKRLDKSFKKAKQ